MLSCKCFPGNEGIRNSPRNGETSPGNDCRTVWIDWWGLVSPFLEEFLMPSLPGRHLQLNIYNHMTYFQINDNMWYLSKDTSVPGAWFLRPFHLHLHLHLSISLSLSTCVCKLVSHIHLQVSFYIYSKSLFTYIASFIL